ncbi:MAG: Holliday junction resolvase RuvX [Chitinispirillales bacterium]|jgi:putative Holliday junction resolvase|nr:Holliday junction resolvase RuvX [Chitinispirillales bacterium]
MKFLCIDYGKRRVGIALSDPSAVLARAKTTIDRKTTDNYLSEIVLLIKEENPDELVVGLPLDVDDNETEFCKEIRDFCSKLKSSLLKEIPINFQDESFSSHKSNLILRKTSSRKKRARKEKVDSVAACIILQEFLDNRSNSHSRFILED